MSILSGFSDFVYPRRCEVCSRICDRDGRYICADCLMRIPFLENCAAEFADVESLQFDRAASALRFEGNARKMILDFKFNGHLWLCSDFVDWMVAALNIRFYADQIDCVVPIAANVLHRIGRGYDQVDILAKSLAKRISRCYLPKVLARKMTAFRRQGSLDEFARRENAAGSYSVRHAECVRGRTVLLVDDILTTGSTLSACARLLKDSGAWRVWTISLARAVRD